MSREITLPGCRGDRRPFVTRAFTLIELLVVIAVIALLIGILLPSLGQARQSARTLKCQVNARSVCQAVATYISTNPQQYYPPHYVYGKDASTMEWRYEDQQISNPQPGNGYVHWSYSLLDSGAVPQDAFSCPTALNGGAPRTNPGAEAKNWEEEQVNDLGASIGSGTPEDRQVRRMAYAGNGAIFPRNKFYASSGGRKNTLVKDSVIEFPSSTILITEYLSRPKWSSLRVNNVIKSHRPITPFTGISSGQDVYSEPTNGTNRFQYPLEADIYSANDQIPDGVIEDANSPLNAVGRHHPGKDSKGGTANFGYIDGHVEQSNILKTIKDRRWGNRFYSLTGDNKVRD
jgi:prepilin-type N-terminal cleavage/methylation domain-containing protein/prepilin-type processing-associated H-X9-DG protein